MVSYPSNSHFGEGDSAPSPQNFRAPLPDHHDLFAKRRSAPALYIVQEDLRVLWSRHDPNERRKDCLAQGPVLPPAVAHTVSRLSAARAQMDPQPSALVSTANASLLVRVVWLDGTPAALAVLVERIRIRDYVSSARDRFGLSERESEVLRLVVEGMTNEEIGRRLHIAKSTAIFHVKRLLVKMDVRNRTELVSRFLG